MKHVLYLVVLVWGFCVQATDFKEFGDYQFYETTYTFTKDGIEHEAIVFHPLGLSFQTFPVSILLHGNGRTFQSHTKLQKRLASHGIVSASLKWKRPTSVKNTLRHHLVYLKEHFQISNNVGLIGHSQGGSAAYIHGTDINQLGYNLKTLVLAAPNPHYQNNGETHYNSDNLDNYYGETNAVLVLYGSKDDDPGTWPVDRETPVRLYDTISTEFSTYQNTRHPVKSMVLIHKTGHDLIDGGASRAYGNPWIIADHLWHLKNDTDAKSWFAEQKNLIEADVDIQFQANEKRVLANFESSHQLTDHLLDGTINFKNIYRKRIIEGDEDKESRHYTGMLRVDWKRRTALRFTPEVEFFVGHRYKDISDYQYLSFRVAQRNSSLNPADKNQKFYLLLIDRMGRCLSVNVENYAEIGPHFEETFVLPPPVNVIEDAVYYVMKTVQIPLEDFANAGIDLEQISSLSFRFTHRHRPSGSIVLDSIAFTK